MTGYCGFCCQIQTIFQFTTIGYGRQMLIRVTLKIGRETEFWLPQQRSHKYSLNFNLIFILILKRLRPFKCHGHPVAGYFDLRPGHAYSFSLWIGYLILQMPMYMYSVCFFKCNRKMVNLVAAPEYIFQIVSAPSEMLTKDHIFF